MIFGGRGMGAHGRLGRFQIHVGVPGCLSTQRITPSRASAPPAISESTLSNPDAVQSHSLAVKLNARLGTAIAHNR